MRSKDYELERLIDYNERVICKLNHLIYLREAELRQQRFMIELIEEVLPLDDNIKRHIHEKCMNTKGKWCEYDKY